MSLFHFHCTTILVFYFENCKESISNVLISINNFTVLFSDKCTYDKFRLKKLSIFKGAGIK
jgi:hypothetical protein